MERTYLVSFKSFEIDVPSQGLDLDEKMNEIEKDLLLKALKRAKGSKENAAKLLNISLRSLRYRLEKHGLL